jgi:hypothetical protein
MGVCNFREYGVFVPLDVGRSFRPKETKKDGL